MKGFISMLAVSMMMIASETASAVYIPGQGPKPHTICFEENLRDAGYQVLLTDLGVTEQEKNVRAEVYDLSLQGSEIIASRRVSLSQDRAGLKYSGNNFSLIIDNPAPGKASRVGQLEVILGNGEKVVKSLRCDNLVHILDGK